jgi:hypothetical protein
MSNLHFYILWQVNSFYDMQFKFQWKMHCLKRHVKSIDDIPEHINSSTSIIRTFTNLDMGSNPISPN